MGRKSEGGGGSQAFCTICGRWHLGVNAEQHGLKKCGEAVMFRGSCRQCGFGILLDEKFCTNCEQRKGKGEKKPICPSCDNLLTPGQTTCSICQWPDGYWQCQTCKRWNKANDRFCRSCTEECPRHKKNYPHGQKCPECAEPASFKLDPVRDEDDVHQRYEILVRLLKTVGTREPQGRGADVWFFDPIQPTWQPVKVPPQGVLVFAEYREEDRTVRSVLADSEDGPVGVSPAEVFLPGKPTRYQPDPVGPYDNPWNVMWS